MPVHIQVKQFIETQHINKNQLARQLGSNATTISNIVRGKSNPSAEFLEKFVELFPHINCFWLLTGKGEMVDHSNPMSIFTEILFEHEYMNPSTRGDFLAFWQKKMDENFNRRLIGSATLKGEKRSLRKITEYMPDGLSFSQVSRTWLESYDAHHARKLEKAGEVGARERERVLKHIKKYLNQAREEMPDARIPDPFVGFKWPRYKSAPVALTEEEVLTILEYYNQPDELYYRMIEVATERGLADHHKDQYASETGVNRLRKVMRGFLFQCLTGVRYSDLYQITYQHIEEGYLIFTPEKTKDSSGAEVRMLITDLMQKLIGKGTGKIFQVFTNQVQNRYLKEIQTICKIDKRLTSHVGRHTFATMGIKKGVALPILADLMGLASIKTLLMYVHTNQQMRDDAMKKMIMNAP